MVSSQGDVLGCGESSLDGDPVIAWVDSFGVDMGSPNSSSCCFEVEVDADESGPVPLFS